MGGNISPPFAGAGILNDPPVSSKPPLKREVARRSRDRGFLLLSLSAARQGTRNPQSPPLAATAPFSRGPGRSHPPLPIFGTREGESAQRAEKGWPGPRPRRAIRAVSCARRGRRAPRKTPPNAGAGILNGPPSLSKPPLKREVARRSRDGGFLCSCSSPWSRQEARNPQSPPLAATAPFSRGLGRGPTDSRPFVGAGPRPARSVSLPRSLPR